MKKIILFVVVFMIMMMGVLGEIPPQGHPFSQIYPENDNGQHSFDFRTHNAINIGFLTTNSIETNILSTINTFQFDKNASIGMVLTSLDNVGNAEWKHLNELTCQNCENECLDENLMGMAFYRVGQCVAGDCVVLKSTFCPHGCDENGCLGQGGSGVVCSSDTECDNYCFNADLSAESFKFNSKVFYGGRCVDSTCVYESMDCPYGCKTTHNKVGCITNPCYDFICPDKCVEPIGPIPSNDITKIAKQADGTFVHFSTPGTYEFFEMSHPLNELGRHYTNGTCLLNSNFEAVCVYDVISCAYGCNSNQCKKINEFEEPCPLSYCRQEGQSPLFDNTTYLGSEYIYGSYVSLINVPKKDDNGNFMDGGGFGGFLQLPPPPNLQEPGCYYNEASCAHGCNPNSGCINSGCYWNGTILTCFGSDVPLYLTVGNDSLIFPPGPGDT